MPRNRMLSSSRKDFPEEIVAAMWDAEMRPAIMGTLSALMDSKAVELYKDMKAFIHLPTSFPDLETKIFVGLNHSKAPTFSGHGLGGSAVPFGVLCTSTRVPFAPGPPEVQQFMWACHSQRICTNIC